MLPGKRQPEAKDAQARSGAAEDQSASNSERAQSRRSPQSSEELWSRYRQSARQSTDTSISTVEQDVETQGVRFRAAHDQPQGLNPLPLPAASAAPARGEPSRPPPTSLPPPPPVAHTPSVAAATGDVRTGVSFAAPIAPGGGGAKGIAASSPTAAGVDRREVPAAQGDTWATRTWSTTEPAAVPQDEPLHGPAPGRPPAAATQAEFPYGGNAAQPEPAQPSARRNFPSLFSNDDSMSSGHDSLSGASAAVGDTVVTAADVHPEPAATGQQLGIQLSGFPDSIRAEASRIAKLQQQQSRPQGAGWQPPPSTATLPGQHQQPQARPTALLPVQQQQQLGGGGILRRDQQGGATSQPGAVLGLGNALTRDPGPQQGSKFLGAAAAASRIPNAPGGFSPQRTSSGFLGQGQPRQRQTGNATSSTALDPMAAAAAPRFPQADLNNHQNQNKGARGKTNRTSVQSPRHPAGQHQKQQSQVRVTPNAAWQDILYSGVQGSLGATHNAQPPPVQHQHGGVQRQQQWRGQHV